MKIHELAKELGYSGTAKFIEDIAKIGVKGKKHHMNVLSSEEESLIRKNLQKNIQSNQNNSNKSKPENLNKNEMKTKENSTPKVSNHSNIQKNNAEQNKNNEK